MELSYIAGFIDGEGTIGITRQTNGKSYCGYIAVVNTYKQVLLDIQDKFGRGSILVANSKGQYGSKVCWRWEIRGKYVCEILSLVIPYLRIKKRQAELVLEYYRDWGHFRSYPGNPIPQFVLDKRVWFKAEIHKLNSGYSEGFVK